MEFGIARGDLATLRTGCLVVGVHEGRALSPSATVLDSSSQRAIDRVLGRGDHDGKPGTTLFLHGLAGVAAERVLLVGVGRHCELAEDGYRTALAAAIKALRTTGARDAICCLHELPVGTREAAWKVEQAALAFAEGLYRFDRLKSKHPEAIPPLEKITFHGKGDADTAALRPVLDRAAAIAQGIRLAKDLGNLPGNLCTPTFLGEQAREVGARHGFDVEVLGPDEIGQLGMGAFAAVARGSREPARLIVMQYRRGPRDAAPVVLVGKGITFDAGGISIKPADEMDEMKFDMCGAASVFGALVAAALLKLPLNAIGIIPAAENMPSGNAMKPGDVVTTMSGQTVEILDTDHEGRLVLCDALTYAERFSPAAAIDIATLTDSIVVALGDIATGVFANDEALARELLAAGDRAWDRAWPMPLWEAYQDKLDSNFADFVNMGPAAGGAITAACFLSRFARKFPWAHLDIAGTASRSGAEKGATGRPVALLVHFLAGRAAA